MKKYTIELEKLDLSNANVQLAEHITSDQTDESLWTESYQASGKEGRKQPPPPTPPTPPAPGDG